MHRCLCSASLPSLRKLFFFTGYAEAFYSSAVTEVSSFSAGLLQLFRHTGCPRNTLLQGFPRVPIVVGHFIYSFLTMVMVSLSFVWEVIVFRIKKLQRMGYPGMPGRRDKGYQSKYFLKIFRNLLHYLLIFKFKNKFIMCPL